MTFGSPLFGLLNVSQAGLEPAEVLAVAAAHLCFQCNVACRSFLQARGSGYQSFNLPWYFISTKCGSSVSARF
jgi:hypothetical protein